MLRAKPRTLKFLCSGAVCLLIACVLLGFRIFRWEPESIEVNHYDVLLKNWHGEHSGLRFVIVSDIHQLALPEDIARLKRIVRLVNDENPDVILLLGDFIGERFNWKRKNASPEAIAAYLPCSAITTGGMAAVQCARHWRMPESRCWKMNPRNC